VATLTLKPGKLQTNGGGRGPTGRCDFGGDGGGGRSDDANYYRERLRRYRFGLAIASVAIGFVFVSVSLTFLMRQASLVWDPFSARYIHDWLPVKLPMALLTLNTILLLFSGVTMELARRQAAERVLLAPVLAIPGIAAGPRQAIPWLAISGALGLGFLAGQAWAWRELVRRGISPANAPATSLFYVLSGAHALHFAGGMLALLYAALIGTWRHRSVASRSIVVDITAWYWHMITALWLYIFVVLAVAA
jgi:cytochrome c oxidase subunit 3